MNYFENRRSPHALVDFTVYFLTEQILPDFVSISISRNVIQPMVSSHELLIQTVDEWVELGSSTRGALIMRVTPYRHYTWAMGRHPLLLVQAPEVMSIFIPHEAVEENLDNLPPSSFLEDEGSDEETRALPLLED